MALPVALHPEHLARPVRPRLTVVVDGDRSASTVRMRRQRVFLIRRLVVGAVVAALVIGGWSLASGDAEGAAGASTAATVVEVRPGDTLWAIAGRLGVDADRRAVVAALAEENGGSVVVPGQHLRIPASVVALAG